MCPFWELCPFPLWPCCSIDGNRRKNGGYCPYLGRKRRYDVLRQHLVDLRLLEFALRLSREILMPVHVSRTWLKLDVMFDGIDRAQMNGL